MTNTAPRNEQYCDFWRQFLPAGCMLFVLVFGACNKTSLFAQNLLVAAHQDSPTGKIILLEIEKDTTVITVVDSSENSMLIPDDLRFVSNTCMAYHGGFASCKNGAAEVRQHPSPNRQCEQIFPLPLGRGDIVVVDSIDMGYFSVEESKSHRYVLLGFEIASGEKIFSVELNGDSVFTHWYSGNCRGPEWVYYPRYFPRSVSAAVFQLDLMVLNIQKDFAIRGRSIRVDDESGTTDHWSMNPRFVRDEGKGRITYLTRQMVPDGEHEIIRLIEWNYKRNVEIVRWEFETSRLGSGRLVHRVCKRKLYLCTESDVFVISKGNKLASVFHSEDMMFLDFLVL